MKLPIGTASIEIVQGDIALQDTIAIANAANNMLWMGAGVAGAIKRAGGESIEEEAVALGPIPIGDVVVTSAGMLKAKFVLHAVVMGQDLHTNTEIITKAMRNTLLVAESRNISSLSVPAFGTGVGGFSVRHCANIMITEAVNFLLAAKSLRLLRFVLFDDETRQAFEDEIHLQFSSKKHPR